ncbi:DUF2490 domain-containing protein [Gramella sp. AN32]|uniref:DUF2490 domain-containing protein n=1 Tax=Christiangramia antarctica TaxID=2058158 RepID=A0ABW5WZE8_9FLAO|nr:DUF2490 domain-containing protein [Gramella sp. AN32]MCM4154859.1 DUF2490 domain-containing protein [Gramella sp. AN32]
MKRLFIASLLFTTLFSTAHAQENDSQLGAWYMYFWNTQFDESKFGLAGDVQYRDWEVLGDLQQFIVRAAVSYNVNSNLKIFAGYGHFISGELGESKETSQENRIHQDILMPQKISDRFLVRHRIRIEERWVENQGFRTRFRYGLFLTIPLTQPDLKKNSLFLSVSDEVFINGQTDIGNNRTVEYFDRNWLYGALGYYFNDNFNVQLGILRQTTPSISKNSLQLGLHHSF